MGSKVLCIICQDDITDPRIHRTREAIEQADLFLSEVDRLAYFSTSQRHLDGGLALTNARQAYRYAQVTAATHSLEWGRDFIAKPKPDFHDTAPPLTSRADVCKRIVKAYVLKGEEVTVCINMVSAPLTKWLLKRECAREGVSWPEARNHVSVIRCGGTFFYNIFRGLKWGFPRWWLREVVWNELHEIAHALRYR